MRGKLALLFVFLLVPCALATIDNSTMTNSSSGSGTTNGLGLVIAPNLDHLHLQNVTFGVNTNSARLRIFDTNGTLLQEVSIVGAFGSKVAITNVTLRKGRSYALVAGSSGAAHAYTASLLPGFPIAATNVNFTNRVWVAGDGAGALNIDTAEVEEIQLVFTNETAPPPPPNVPPVITNVSIITPSNPANDSVTINFTAHAYDTDNSTITYLWSLHNGSQYVASDSLNHAQNITVPLGTYLVTFNQTFNLTVNVTDGTNTVSSGALLNQTILNTVPEPDDNTNIFTVDLTLNYNVQLLILLYVLAIILILVGIATANVVIFYSGCLIFIINGFVLLSSDFNAFVSACLILIGFAISTLNVQMR